MAVKLITTYATYIAAAADAKPAGVAPGSRLLEYDTGRQWVTHDGTNWSVVSPITTAPAAAAHVNAPAANTAAVITLAATASKKHYIPRVVWSYDAAPTGGRLTITDDGTTVFDLSITAAGPGVIDVGIESAAVNKAMVITLAAGGGVVVGKVNIPGARTA